MIPFPLKRYLDAIIDAALSGVMYSGISYLENSSLSNTMSLSHSFSIFLKLFSLKCLALLRTMVSGLDLEVRDNMKSSILSPWYLNVFPKVIPSHHEAFNAVFPISIMSEATLNAFISDAKIQNYIKILCHSFLKTS